MPRAAPAPRRRSVQCLMPARIIDGNALARQLREQIAARVGRVKGGGAVVRLDADALEAGASGELVVLLRPRELALIAGVPGDGD